MPKRFTLDEAVAGTVRRGETLATKKLAILNFGSTGPRSLDGTLPVLTGPISQSTQDRLSELYRFKLDAKVQVGIDIIDGRAGIDISSPDWTYYAQNHTWREFFSADPASQNLLYIDKIPERDGNGAYLPSLYLEEALKVYRTTLGIDYDLSPQSVDPGLTNVFVGVNGIYNFISAADTETREPFLDLLQGDQLAGFTYINLPWMAGFFADPESTAGFYGPGNNFDFNGTSLTSAQVLAHSVFKNTVHELGHVLGLQHPGNYNGSEPKSISEFIWQNDSFDQSIMSYASQDVAKRLLGVTDGFWVLPITPRTLDFLALDSIYSKQTDEAGRPYGTSRAFNGNTRYGFNSTIQDSESVVYGSLDELFGYRVAVTIPDGNGNDILDFSGYRGSSLIDLHVMTGDETESRLSSINGSHGNLSLAVGTVIENAIGGFGDDILKDNQFNNILMGNDGEDSFEVSAGYDIIIGGTGVDQASLARPVDDFLIGHLNPWTSVLRSKDGLDQVVLNGIESVAFKSPIGEGRTRYFSVDSLNLTPLHLTPSDKDQIDQQLVEIGILNPNQYTL